MSTKAKGCRAGVASPAGIIRCGEKTVIRGLCQKHLQAVEAQKLRNRLAQASNPTRNEERQLSGRQRRKLRKAVRQ